MHESQIPILVGVAQITDHPGSGRIDAPVELMTRAAQAAISDCGTQKVVNAISNLSVASLAVDADAVKTPFKRSYDNLPKSVARRLGIQDCHFQYAAPGGNTPQYLVNHHAKRIIEGHNETTLIVGGEAIYNMFEKYSGWYTLIMPWRAWREKTGSSPVAIGDNTPGSSAHEELYNLSRPTTSYPLFENALQAHYGRTSQAHHQKLGELFSRLTKIASQNPHAWDQTERSSDELLRITKSNRMITYPYTKLLNSIFKVNQFASLILTSVEKAREIGISSDKWVYLPGFADQNDHWFLSERENYYSSPAIRSAGNRALEMAGIGIDEIDFLDIYSCFPSAVEIACDELNIKHDDARGLSLTGGLPYFGGPGSNYNMHAIVEVVNKLRESKTNSYGLVNANGWHLTKHAIGVYSNARPKGGDVSLSTPVKLSTERVPTFTETAQGAAQIETFTVLYNKQGTPDSSLIIGRDSQDKRFIANGPIDPDSVNKMTGQESVVGTQGKVTHRRGRNQFQFES